MIRYPYSNSSTKSNNLYTTRFISDTKLINWLTWGLHHSLFWFLRLQINQENDTPVYSQIWVNKILKENKQSQKPHQSFAYLDTEMVWSNNSGVFWYLLDQKQSSKESESSSWVLQKKMIGNVREKQRDKRLIGLVLGLGSFFFFFQNLFLSFWK